MLARFDLVNLIRDQNEEDAFYYFQIARNLAEGKFSTFDGGITRTNGYHPLWLFLITPFYWIFDKETALFAIKAFEIMLLAGGVALVTGAARLARLPWILMFAALPMLYQHHVLFTGTEAAAGLFMLGLFILYGCAGYGPCAARGQRGRGVGRRRHRVFLSLSVVNLDGLVNSYSYLRAQREGTEATFYPRYGITHLANTWATMEGTEDHVLPAERDYLVLQRREHPSVGEILFEGPPYLLELPRFSGQ